MLNDLSGEFFAWFDEQPRTPTGVLVPVGRGTWARDYPGSSSARCAETRLTRARLLETRGVATMAIPRGGYRVAERRGSVVELAPKRGAYRSRTGVPGFADLCLTTRPRRRAPNGSRVVF